MVYKHQRVGVFIDIQNLYHSAKHLYSARINYRELIKELSSSRQLIRVIGYVVKSETALGEKAFFEALEKAGVELRMKDLQIFPGGVKKADWDVGMAIDAIKMAPKLDAVVLATGDGDFVPLVEYLKYTYGVQVEVIAFGKSSSGQLREAVDDFIDICEDPRAFLIGYRGGVGRYIPGFGGKSGADSNAGRVNADTSIETTEWDGEGEDPAIKMSGE